MDNVLPQNNKGINPLALGDIYLNLNNMINDLINEENMLAYLESSVKLENNLPQNDIQLMLFKLKQLRNNLIIIKKKIKNFSINNNEYINNVNNNYKQDEIVKEKLQILKEEYMNALFNNKSFIIKFPILISFRENFLSGQLDSLSKQKINKGKNRTLSLINFKIKNNNSFNNIKNNILTERNVNSNLNNEKKRIKIDILKNKIKNIQINFENAQMETKINNTTNYKNNENPINKNLTEFNYLKNEINTNPNLLSELNCSSSRERLRYMSEQNSFLKKENRNILSNPNFHIHNSSNNSSINLNIINHNNGNRINNIIPNNYNIKNRNNCKINSLENYKKLNTNPNIQDMRHKVIKTSNNKKTFNFPLKNILFHKNSQIKLNFKKLKSKAIKQKNDYNNNILKSHQIKDNKNINSFTKILYSKPFNIGKRSNSEYLLKPIKTDMPSSKTNNNSLNVTYNLNDNNITGFSLENLNTNNIEYDKNAVQLRKKKVNIRNRTLQILNDNSSIRGMITSNKNISFNKNLISNIKTEFKNSNNNNKEKLNIDYDTFLRTQEENKKLKKDINNLKNEIESIKLICQKLNIKIINLEEQNKFIKKENATIMKLLKINKLINK